ncbi:Pfam:DUF672 [Seminavis robusta]|uniref:Pfam:DUF672 n=1 Tax=Seminavis robusta TaxID=568900 RepID=A0A9N8EQ59_9STRA|nr:Pfam:DUF672 [Seminavis robusta]|eukprot:Sro1376_g267460.1 Pfam:DUF672 (335) ;mRNA; r:13604-14608
MFSLGMMGGYVMKRESDAIFTYAPRLLSADTLVEEFAQQMLPTTSSQGQREVHICHENPYKDSLLPNHSFATAELRAQLWMANKTNIRNALYFDSHDKNTHAKFNAFDVMAPCHQNCTGDCGSDASKIVCGIQHLQEGCIVYSIGSNNNWIFEEEIYNMTPCHIHTFDCTGPKQRFQPPAIIRNRHTFHHMCLSSHSEPTPTKIVPTGRIRSTIMGPMETLEGMQRMLNHTRLDLLKMDVEGYEFPLFESWPELTDLTASSKVFLPMQVLVEIHYSTHMKDLRPSQPGVPFKTEIELVALQEHLLKMGYVVAVRDDNRLCRHCTELTLLRHKCI